MASNHGHHDHQTDGLGNHISPISTYLKVAAALFVLTILTVTAHQMHLGPLAGPVAFVIATVKAFLVLIWFMHLKYDTKINRIIFATGFFFLLVLFAFSVIDISTRAIEHSVL